MSQREIIFIVLGSKETFYYIKKKHYVYLPRLLISYPSLENKLSTFCSQEDRNIKDKWRISIAVFSVEQIFISLSMLKDDLGGGRVKEVIDKTSVWT